MNKHMHCYPIKLERIQQDIIKTRRQMNQLGKLYETRDIRDNNLRFGVKPRFKINENQSFFRRLRLSLKVKTKGRLQ